MLISKNNLLQFIDISNIESIKIKELLTQHTAEVENIYESTNKYLENVIVGKIVDINSHPDKSITKVRVTKVNIGNNKILNIFCGAQNICIGMYVPIAMEGAVLANGMQINKRDLKGVISEGMICSRQELGLSDIDDGGIWDLSNEIKNLHLNENSFLGENIKNVLQIIDDTVFDIDNKTLSNRPDLFCHKGIARELATILDLQMQDFDYSFNEKNFGKDLHVDIRTKNCLRYTSIKIDNINVEPSPIWLQRALKSVGIQSVNNIVDITNYVMIMIGQPMHAFDFDKVGGIIVRQANFGENIVLLNNKEYKLNKTNTLICNKQNVPIALAGVMGALNSGITNNTKNILLESACFDPYNIRKTTIDLNIRTDASTRYEKALDPELTRYGIILATNLILNICSGSKISSNIVDVYNKKYKQVQINISRSDIKKIIGIDFDNNFIEKVLLKLGFDVQTKTLNSWLITVPSWRATRDISIKEDIAEEIARIYGFNNIKSIRPIVALCPAIVNKERDFIDKIKLILSYTFNEAFVYSFSYKDQIEKCKFDFNKCIKMLNSLTSYATTLIPSLMIPLLECVQKNVINFNKFKIFTVDRIWLKDNNINKITDTEINMVAGVVYGYDNVFYEMQSEIIRLFTLLKITNISFRNVSLNKDQFYPNIYADIFIDNKKIGCVGNIHPQIIKTFDINNDVCYFEFDIKKVYEYYQYNNTNIKMNPISVYPYVYRDLNFVFDKAVKNADILDFKHDLIVGFKIIDVYYDDKKIGKDKKSITIRYTINSNEKTLTENEINDVVQKIIDNMIKKGGILRT